MITLPKIDYLFWKNKNDYFSDVPLIKTIQIGIKHAEKGGLIRELLTSNKVTTNKDLVELIANKISTHNSLSAFSGKELLEIFDLIQAWGGKSGRGPYVKPKNSPSRFNDKFSDLYRVALDELPQRNYQKILKKFLEIPQLGESFATKHMFFWSTYGEGSDSLPIFDTRIKVLLSSENVNKFTYEDYVSALIKKGEELKIPSVEVERALFSFSQNFFPNEKLILKIDILDKTDYETAKYLAASEKSKSKNMSDVFDH
jgi:hypothetical protein